jgi:ABC-2 type transport system permease protein
MLARPWSKPYWSLVWELTRSEFKLRDQGTVFGFFWTLLHPAMMFTVLYVVFVKWLGHQVPRYGSYLIVGLVQWQFFEKATTAGFSNLRRKAPLLRNFKFASEITVLAGVGSVFVSYVFEVAVMIFFVRLSGVPFTPAWLLLPLHMAALLAVSLATALILALLSIEFQDMERIWSVLLATGFYLTPVFYPIGVIAPEYHRYMRLNPMLHMIAGFRGCMLADSPPEYGLPAAIGVCALAMTLAGVAVFRKYSLKISDRIILP